MILDMTIPLTTIFDADGSTTPLLVNKLTLENREFIVQLELRYHWDSTPRV